MGGASHAEHPIEWGSRIQNNDGILEAREHHVAWLLDIFIADYTYCI